MVDSGDVDSLKNKGRVGLEGCGRGGDKFSKIEELDFIFCASNGWMRISSNPPRLNKMNMILSSITAVLLCTLTTGFYLPGVAPREFKEGDNVPLKVDKISSVRSQLPYR